MKDMHSHLLYGIDDGCKTMDEAIQLLKDMERLGIKELILTPHYIENSKYDCNNKSKEALFRNIKKRAKEENIKIELYLGNEVFITPNLLELIEKGEIKTLNESKYLLFELPMNQSYNNTFLILNTLTSHGYIPVLAHPERYQIFQKHPKELLEYIRAGVLLQGNFTSLFDKYGKKERKVLKLLLKNKWITFLGSDTHHTAEWNEEKLEKMLLKITKDKEYVMDLMDRNFDKIIQNKDIGIIQMNSR